MTTYVRYVLSSARRSSPLCALLRALITRPYSYSWDAVTCYTAPTLIVHEPSETIQVVFRMELAYLRHFNAQTEQLGLS